LNLYKPISKSPSMTVGEWQTNSRSRGSFPIELCSSPLYTKEMKVITLVDRRVDPPPPPQEWLFQPDLEDLLHPATDGTNGAFYRLLNGIDAGRGKALSGPSGEQA